MIGSFEEGIIKLFDIVLCKMFQRKNKMLNGQNYQIRTFAMSYCSKHKNFHFAMKSGPGNVELIFFMGYQKHFVHTLK